MSNDEKVEIVQEFGERWAFEALLLHEQGKHFEAAAIQGRALRAAKYVTKRRK